MAEYVCIRKKYDADEIGQRILNGDGGSWINEPYDPDAIFQLDRYHICQEILRKISDKDAQKEIRELFEADKSEEMLEYIKTYATSVESPDEKDNRSKKAQELYKYLDNNRDGLLPYDKRRIKIAEPPEGVVYKGMGVQENQNCTVITLRMKHRRMRWSVSGANNLAKALYRKENRELIETIYRYTDIQIYRWPDLYNADAGNRRKPECSKSTKEGRKRQFVCRCGKCPHADTGSCTDSIKKSF